MFRSEGRLGAARVAPPHVLAMDRIGAASDDEDDAAPGGSVSRRNHHAAMLTLAPRISIAMKIERQPKRVSRNPPVSGATMGEITIAMVT